MNIYSSTSLLAFIVCVYLGWFVYLKGTKKNINRFFALATVCTGTWSLFPFLTSIAPSDANATCWGRLVYIAAFFTPPTFLHFIFALTGIERQRREKNIIKAIYLISSLFLIILFHPDFIQSVNRRADHCVVVPGSLYLIYVIFFGTISPYVIYKAFKVFQKAHGYKKTQLRYLFLAFVFAFWGAVLHFGAAYIGKEPFPHDFLIIAYVLIMAYAIVQYRLMDISVVIAKGVVYVVLLILAGAGYLGLMTGVDKVFSGIPGYDVSLAHFLIFLVMALVLIYYLPNVRFKTEKAVEKALFKGKYDYRDTLREFTKRLTFIPGQDELLDATVRNVAGAIGTSKATLLLQDETSGDYSLRAQVGLDGKGSKDFVIPSDRRIVAWLAHQKQTFVKEEAEKILSPNEIKQINKDLDKISATVCIPLLVEDKLIGLMTLSERESGEMYSHMDIEALETLASQLALAIRYRELESQMHRNENLISLGTLAGSLAHQIKNPLSSIQTFAQLLPEKYDDDEFRNEFSQIVDQDTHRIAQIIDSIMALARPKSPELHACDLVEIIDETLMLVDTKLKTNNIAVHKDYAKVPKVKGDNVLLRQVFLNLFINAMQAMSEKGDKIDVSVTLLKGKIKSYVNIKIEDNGAGIDEKLLGRLFEPFFTTKDVGKYRGLGLGLSIVHRIIREHGGTIEVKSKVGEGTTFLVSLPVTKEK